MLINSGKYTGSGAFRRDGETAKNSIECSIEITAKNNVYIVVGHWSQRSKNKDNAFRVTVHNLVGNNLENVEIDYVNYSFTGALNSIGEYSTGLFATKHRTEIIGVTVLTMDDGYRISGTLIANQKAMFDIKVWSTDPRVSQSNVVGLAG